MDSKTQMEALIIDRKPEFILKAGEDAARLVNLAWEIVRFLFSVKQKPDKLAEKEEEKRGLGDFSNEVAENNVPRD